MNYANNHTCLDCDKIIQRRSLRCHSCNNRFQYYAREKLGISGIVNHSRGNSQTDKERFKLGLQPNLRFTGRKHSNKVRRMFSRNMRTTNVKYRKQFAVHRAKNVRKRRLVSVIHVALALRLMEQGIEVCNEVTFI